MHEIDRMKDDRMKDEKNEYESGMPQAAAENTSFPLQMSKEEYHATEKRLKRKLDLRLMASIVFIYILNYLDRNNIAAAKVAGIEESLHLTSTQFSSAVSLLFAGYIVMQVPSNIFLAKVRPSIYLPACMAAWGVISACTGAVKSATGLYLVRFFLGFVEAAYYPGSIFLIGSWYKRSELGLRCAILYSGAQIGSAFSGLIAAGITQGLNGAHGLAAWQWIFIIEGSITVAFAICAFFTLPNYPGNTVWLSPEEQAVAEWRLLEDVGQLDEEEVSWGVGLKSALKDWRTYGFAALFHCVMVTTSTQNFFPAVVDTLGFGEIQTLLLTVPPYVVGAAISITNNWSADRTRNSSFHIMAPMAMALVGFVVGAATLNTGARYFSMFLMIAGGHGANAVTIAWAQKTMIRPRIKRAAAVAFVNACGNTAQIWTAYLYTNNAAPRYVLAMSINSGFALGGIAIALFMRITLVRANRKLATGADVYAVTKQGERIDRAVVTEGRQDAMKHEFRYVT